MEQPITTKTVSLSEPRVVDTSTTTTADDSVEDTTATASSSKQVEIDKFEHAGLSKPLLKAIYGYGWEQPSDIQRHGIPAILSETDCMIQAQSGTGKTGTYSIGTLHRLDLENPTIQAIILEPTRELADQSYLVMKALSQHLQINLVKCVGKRKVNVNLPFPDRATVLIGTPGKTDAVVNKKFLKQSINLKIFVVDEFDEMLQDKNLGTIHSIFKASVNPETQVVLVSATTNQRVLDISKTMFRAKSQPIMITRKNEELTLEGIRQYHIDCGQERYKIDTILDLYSSIVIKQCVIFVNTKRQCDFLTTQLREQDFTVSAIHGGMEQSERDQVMDDFRQSNSRILISTNLTARGIDIHHVSIVINYDLPYDRAQYLHRIGRCGRYGKKGVSISLIGSADEMDRLKQIEQFYQTTIPPLPSNFIELLGT
jgi:superfamily II DNA/RNA helicase